MYKNHNLKIKNYNCLRKGRDNSAGGVAIFIKNNIPFKEVKVNGIISLEHICVKLVSDIYLIAAYNNPSNEFTTKEIEKLMKVGDKVILYGDLNARHTAWNCHIVNRRGLVIFDFVQNNNCSLLYPNECTNYPANGMTPTTIDIGLNKNVRSLSEVRVAHELSSDHIPVLFSLGGQHKIIKNRTIFDYDKADWLKFHKLLTKNIIMTPKIGNSVDLEKEVQRFTNILQNTINKTIPKKPLGDVRDNLPPQILDNIHEKRRTRKEWQRTKNADIKILLNKQTRLIRSDILKFRNQNWQNKLLKLNPNNNSLWKMTKILKTEYQPIPTLQKNDEEAFTSLDKANMLTTHY